MVRSVDMRLVVVGRRVGRHRFLMIEVIHWSAGLVHIVVVFVVEIISTESKTSQEKTILDTIFV